MNRQATMQHVQTREASEPAGRVLQRKCACGNYTGAGGKCDACVNKNNSLQRKETNEDAVGGVPAIARDVLRSPGRPLEATTRRFMEPRFRRDFSDIRVHADASAAASADAVNAIAFAAGRHIVFGDGEYAPETERGRHVLAHELAHTLQTDAPHGSGIRRIPKDPEGAPFDGEIIPWSAALRRSPNRASEVLADLPRQHAVSVLGGSAWILVDTLVEGRKLTGYVSHELIRQVSAPASKGAGEPTEKTAEEVAKVVTSSAEKKPGEAGAAIDAPVAALPNLTQLKTLLDVFNIDEQEVINLLRLLTTGEVAIVAAGTWYKDRLVSALTDAEMIDALDAMKLTGALRLEWKKAEGITSYEIKFDDDFTSSLEGASLDPELRRRVAELCQYLVNTDLVSDDIVVKDGMRLPIRAHQLSTAYNIQIGTITQGRLEALPGGKDLDGNLWWKKGWTLSDAVSAAKSVWPSRDVAYEGYRPADPRRLPNLDEVPMSQHCAGQAMDVTIPWRKGDGWHAEANALVEKFELSRPLKTERWHFELRH